MALTLYNWEVLTHKKDVPNYFYILADDGAGHLITTARIISVSGNLIKDLKGREFYLDKPAPQYIEYCKDMGWYIPTTDEPILVTKKF